MLYSLSEAVEFIKSDVYRCVANSSKLKVIKEFVTNRSLRYLFWYRLSKVNIVLLRFPAMFFRRYLSIKYGLLIPRQANIGYGLFIGHHMCVVINSSTTIGNNCNLSQFTSIGSNSGQAAIIGDNVYIGPNVCLVENVIIGENVVVAAGAIVVKNAPPNCTVGGNPAKIISFNNSQRFIRNKWVIKGL